MNRFREIVTSIVDALTKSSIANFIIGCLWFFNMIGGTIVLAISGYGHMAIADILMSILLLAIAYRGKPNTK